jgi:hypothetical protein
MSKGLVIRFLVPSVRRGGKLEYQVEEKFVRLPVKREDRDALRDRLR